MRWRNLHMTSPTKQGKTAKTVRTTVSMPRTDYEELERLADKNRVSVAWVVREAVQTYLDSKTPLFRESEDGSTSD